MRLLVEAAAGEELSIGGERHAVDRLLVPGKGYIVIFFYSRACNFSKTKAMPITIQ